jgi:pimeloyl-ACP methyl ester carboxylesterase
VIIPVGHSGKQFKSYQLTAQFFARCGYLAVTFDPPGQASEKQPGNDHFVDGVRCYLVGQTYSRYVVADALRCVDYLAARGDVDMQNGVAMTGVSGGGTTTTLAGLLDDRITVLGPSCCLTPLADLDITQCYAGCPETHMFRRYAEGIDEVDLLCAACPKPTLLMAGRLDEVFHIEDTLKLAEEVKGVYAADGIPNQFELFVDEAGHCYSLDQARAFVAFMNRWLRKNPGKDIPSTDNVEMHSFDECKCFPRTDVNMRTLTLDLANHLAQTRDRDPDRICRAARKIAGIESYPAAVPEAVCGRPFQVWAHTWQQVLLKPEPDIELPATFLYPVSGPAPVVLHFDDQHRNSKLKKCGLLTETICFAGDNPPHYGVLSVDVRGWGDSAPAMYPYELAGWGGTDRFLAYMSAALGDPVMAMRIRDGLSALAYLRSRPEIDPKKIVVSGCGLGGIVALHVAAIDRNVCGPVVWDSLISFQALLETENYTWPADAFLPNALLDYDLPDLAAVAANPVIVNPKDGRGQLVSENNAEKWYGKNMNVKVLFSDNYWKVVVHPLQQLLAGNGKA